MAIGLGFTGTGLTGFFTADFAAGLAACVAADLLVGALLRMVFFAEAFFTAGFFAGAFFKGPAGFTEDCLALEDGLEALFFAGDGWTRDGLFGEDLATGTPCSFQHVHPPKAYAAWYAIAQWAERWLITHKPGGVNKLIPRFERFSG